MLIKELFTRTRNLARSLAHFGHLGKTAGQRSFLSRERKKILLKLGETTLGLIRNHKAKIPELERLVQHLDKIDALLAAKDYGGERGRAFHPHPRTSHEPKSAFRKRKR